MRVAALNNTARSVKRYTTAFLLLVVVGLVAPEAYGQQANQPAVNPYDELLVSAARRYQLDLYTLRAQMYQESSNKPGAISPKGASGLMQLMPATANRFGVLNIFDPAQNIEGGARYMRFLLDLFGENYTLALAAYNAGEGAVMKYGRRVPPYQETQAYVATIQRKAMLYRAGLASPAWSRSVANLVRNTSLQRGRVPTEITPDSSPQASPQPSQVETASRYFFQ